MGPLALGALGVLLGMRHATDADHVVAVTTIACRERTVRGALYLGMLWGIGHTITVLLVGGAIIVFGAVIPPRLGLSLEMAVAVMLIVLGARNLARGVRHESHVERRVRPMAIGIVHGLAGSAAIALMVLASIHSSAQALLYLGLFGAGTVVGMMVLTVAMVLPVRAAAHRFNTVERMVGKLTGAASLVFGLVLTYRLGFLDGLFTSAPHWTPR
ncbi:MAG TPA: high-affinity nickel-transport family protein [Polyangia bacterium]|nr:high-affinity nickel-transport family protein [Polyangia bacterium]